MSPSLSIVLPSIQGGNNTKTKNKVIKKHQHHQRSFIHTIGNTKKEQQQRHHIRTTSVPLPITHYNNSKEEEQLSMDILLDAIDLDQQMRQFFRSELVKSKNRDNIGINTFQPNTIMAAAAAARRRSKSAPGAPPSYHEQRAISQVQWMTSQGEVVTNSNHADVVAKMIVQQHIKAAVVNNNKKI